MPRRSAHRRSRPVFEDSASGLAREVMRRRAQARHLPEVPSWRASGDGRGMTIRDAADVHAWSRGRIAELEYEEAWVLVINKQRRLIKAERVEEGSVGKTHLDTSRVLRVANVPQGAGFILVHNHPSDIPKPGKADIAASNEVLGLAERRGLNMLDSVIVGRTSYSSIADLGLMDRAGTSRHGSR